MTSPRPFDDDLQNESDFWQIPQDAEELPPGTLVEVFSRTTGAWVPARVATGSEGVGEPVAVELVALDGTIPREGLITSPNNGSAKTAEEQTRKSLNDITIRLRDEAPRLIADVLEFRQRGDATFVSVTALEEGCVVMYTGPQIDDSLMKVFIGQMYEDLAQFTYVDSVHAMMSNRAVKVQPGKLRPFFLGIELLRGLNSEIFLGMDTRDQQRIVQRSAYWAALEQGLPNSPNADFLISYSTRNDEANHRLLKHLVVVGARKGPWGDFQKTITFCSDLSLGLGHHFGNHVDLRMGCASFGQEVLPKDVSEWLQNWTSMERQTRYGILILAPSLQHLQSESCNTELKLVSIERQYIYNKDLDCIVNRVAHETHWQNVMPAVLNAARSGDLVELDAVLSDAPDSILAADAQGRTALHLAAASGHSSAVLRLLDAAGHVESRTLSGVTPLQCAALGGHDKVVGHLLDGLADIESQDNEGFTPLHCVAFHGHDVIVPRLLKAMADIHMSDGAGGTSLHYASLYGHETVVLQLLSVTADANSSTKVGATPFHCAALGGHDSIAMRLLDASADMHCQDQHGETAFSISSRPDIASDTPDIQREGRTRIANLLRSHLSPAILEGAIEGDIGMIDAILRDNRDAIHSIDGESRTALHLSARYGHAAVVARLMCARAAVDVQDVLGATPLHTGSLHGHEAVVARLLSAHSNVDHQTFAGATPLHFAALYGRKAVFVRLLAARADVMFATQSGVTPLDCTELSTTDIWNADEPLNHALLDSLLDMQGDDNTEELSRLSRAARKGEIAELEASISAARWALDSTDSHGRSALHHAALSGHERMVTRLLTAKANLFSRDASGRTCLHHAVAIDSQHVVACLLQSLATLHERDDQGAIPLHYAALQGHENTLSQMLVANCRVDDQTLTSSTALHLAVSGCHVNSVQCLLDARADAHILDREGESALTLSQKACANFEKGNNSSSLMKVFQNLGLERPERYEHLLRAVESDRKHEQVGRMLAVHVSHPAVRAACLGDVGGMDAAINLNAGLHGIVDENLRTPLHIASRYGHVDVVDTLLNVQRLVSIQDSRQWLPLHYGAFYGHEAIVDLLLIRRSSASVENIGGCLPIHLAARAGHEAIVKRLVKEKRAFIESQDLVGCTPLHYAALHGRVGVATYLTSMRSSIDCITRSGFTVLHCAGIGGHDAIAQELLDLDANPQATDTDGNTPLTLASGETSSVTLSDGRHKVIKLLVLAMTAQVLKFSRLGDVPKLADILQSDAEAYKTLDDHHHSALHIAGRYGHQAVVVLLLKAMADVSGQDKSGCTALHFASGYGHISVIERLLNCEADLHINDAIGCTPLHYASFYGKNEAVSCLLIANAKVEARDVEGGAPLHHGTLGGHEVVVTSLLRSLANVEARDAFGSTTMHIVALFGYDNLFPRLLNASADVHCRDNDGRSALDHALEPEPEVEWWEGHEKTVRLFMRAGAQPSPQLGQEKQARHIGNCRPPMDAAMGFTGEW